MRSRELSNKAFCLINSLSTQNKSRWALSDAGYKDHYKESNTAPNTVRLFKMPQNKLNVNHKLKSGQNLGWASSLSLSFSDKIMLFIIYLQSLMAQRSNHTTKAVQSDPLSFQELQISSSFVIRPDSLPKWLTPMCISKPSAVLEQGHIITPALLIKMWSCFSSAGKRRWSVRVATHSCYILEICLTTRL